MNDVAPEESGDQRVDPLVGAVLNERYEVVRRLDQGGMGSVYEGRQVAIDKRVVIKVLHDEFARDADMVERFKREARAATSIGHEHIVDVTDLGELRDGSPFIVMEYLDGRSLAQLLEDDGPLRVSRAIRITRQICDALAGAHAKGIVHRDMKPDNVFLVSRGRNQDFVKVLDFGISKIKDAPGSDSKLTKTGVAMGTPAYMAPEQAQGLRSLDHRADIYAVGVMLFETLAGRLPFEAESYAALLLKMMTAPAPLLTRFRADVPAGLAAIVHKMMEKLPVDRPGSMVELSASLEAFEELDVEPQLVGAAPAGPTTDRPTQLERRAATELQGAHDPADSMRPPSMEPPSMKETEPVLEAVSAAEEPRTTTSSSVVRSPADPLPTRSLPTAALFAAAAILVGLAGVGAWWVSREPVPASPPAAQEVRLRIRVTPADAVIELDGTMFPNPTDVARPRSLDPVALHIEREGYRPMERTIVLDQDRSYDFELAELAELATEIAPPTPGDQAPATEPTADPTTQPATEPAGPTGRRGGRRGGGRAGAEPRSAEPPGEETATPDPPPVDDGVYQGRRGGLREEF